MDLSDLAVAIGVVALYTYKPALAVVPSRWLRNGVEWLKSHIGKGGQ